MKAVQTSLFGREPIGFDPALGGVRRRPLSGGAWLELLPGWLQGHAQVFDVLERSTRWQHGRRPMYDRVVDVPRLTATLPEDGEGLPVLGPMADALSAHYGWQLERISLAYYRDGNDSVAWHGDELGPLREDGIVATVSVGEPRRFLLRPASGGHSLALTLGWGDLLVMGGSCQKTWQHCVPKAKRAGPRISIMFRPQVPEGAAAAPYR